VLRTTVRSWESDVTKIANNHFKITLVLAVFHFGKGGEIWRHKLGSPDEPLSTDVFRFHFVNAAFRSD
jgi:hypothetical protein